MHNNSSCQVTVIGAGPYGLATASHLRAAGAEVRTFGKAMDFWSGQMPKGMLLRSPWSGSTIGGPHHALTLDDYESTLETKLDRRVPVEDFVRYGRWFQRKAVPDLDSRGITLVEREDAGFRIALDDGETFSSRAVVVAAGIGSFSRRPAVFRSSPLELVSHTSDRRNHDLGQFAGKRVAVIGAGQSAIESAALLTESGAEAEVLVRRPQLHWLGERAALEKVMDLKFNPFRSQGKIGPVGLDWLIEHPGLYTMMPRNLQDAAARRGLRPAASGWLRPRTERVAISTNRWVLEAAECHGRVHLRLNDGTERLFDHVLLGTGYEIDIARYGFLSGELLRNVKTIRGYPVLNRGFESSVTGLYFVGAAAAYSFGPFLRFVIASQYAAGSLSRYFGRTQTGRSIGLPDSSGERVHTAC